MCVPKRKQACRLHETLILKKNNGFVGTRFSLLLELSPTLWPFLGKKHQKKTLRILDTVVAPVPQKAKWAETIGHTRKIRRSPKSSTSETKQTIAKKKQTSGVEWSRSRRVSLGRAGSACGCQIRMPDKICWPPRHVAADKDASTWRKSWHP